MDAPLSLEPGDLSKISIMTRWFDVRGFPQDCEIEVEHFDLDRARPEDIMARCMDARTMHLSATARDLAGIHKDNGPEEAVYIIAPTGGKVCKIGVARNPLARLRGLQTSNHEQLELHALFWSLEGWPEQIERAALKAAQAMGLRLKGEWVDSSPEFAALLVASTIKAANVKVADGEMILRQRERIRKERKYWT